MSSLLPLNYTLEEIYTKYKTLASPSPASKTDVEWCIGIKKAPPWNTRVPSRPNNNRALRCIQQGLGYCVEWSITDYGLMVSQGGNSPNKFSRVASSLSSKESIWKGMVENHSSVANGQYYGCKLHQPEKGDNLIINVATSYRPLSI